MRKTLLLGFMLFFIALGQAQESPTCYRIQLTDKQDTPYSIDNPLAFLSERAIAKRTRFGIAITEQDLPVNPHYLQQILSIDTAIRKLCVSKWMNTVTIYCPDSTLLPTILALPFVENILPVAAYDINPGASFSNGVPERYAEPMVSNSYRDTVTPYDYGSGYEQIAMHNGHLLHNLGFRGDGMLIAVFDAGWNWVDSSWFFRRLFDEGRLWGTVDLVPWSNNVFEGHSHGTIVTSTMAGAEESVLVGTAPEANYFFIRSEEPSMEQLIEEDFWAQAAEIADSIGADVINSSLGYSTFPQFPQGNFTYQDVDGVTSIASRAATILAHKGVIVCISAGNEGTSSWHYISHPADAFDVLAVGAADVFGNIAYFSSRGPTYDGRVKPDVVSCGVNTACMWPYDFLGTADGTSLAGPVLAGLCACLWQALPNASSTQVMQFIRESGSCYLQPNDSLGFGIPDFFEAYSNHNSDGVSYPEHLTLSVFPNPCTDYVHIPNPKLDIVRVTLVSPSGKMVRNYQSDSKMLLTLNVKDLPNGIYIGQALLRNGQIKPFKIVK